MSNGAGRKTYCLHYIFQSFAHKSGLKSKNKQHLAQELVVITHNQQHGEENMHHSVRAGQG